MLAITVSQIDAINRWSAEDSPDYSIVTMRFVVCLTVLTFGFGLGQYWRTMLDQWRTKRVNYTLKINVISVLASGTCNDPF